MAFAAPIAAMHRRRSAASAPPEASPSASMKTPRAGLTTSRHWTRTRRLAFRDALRASLSLASEYQNLKRACSSILPALCQAAVPPRTDINQT
jgi:GrpB-like predicted nucleotidyltransferase (UPF0157 family)